MIDLTDATDEQTWDEINRVWNVFREWIGKPIVPPEKNPHREKICEYCGRTAQRLYDGFKVGFAGQVCQNCYIDRRDGGIE